MRPVLSCAWMFGVLLMVPACARPVFRTLQEVPDHLSTSWARKENSFPPNRGSDPIALRVVYPAPEDRVRVRDSSFLFGSVASGDVELTINDNRVRVWPDGGWLAWLPFPAESVMEFKIQAKRGQNSAELMYPVRRDPRFFPAEVKSGGVWI